MNAKHISIIVAFAALLAGCAKSPIEEVKPSEQLVDLELSAVNATETKAAIDGTDFPQKGEIGLFLFKNETATQDYGDGYKNIKYTYNSSISKWTASPSIKVGSDAGYLFGYYPYDSEVTSIKAIPVKSSLNGDDVMYATKQAVTDATASQTSITMNHALARVSIKVINKGYTGAAKLSEIKFADAKTSLSGNLDATTGAISGTTRADVTLTVPSGKQTITSDGTAYECLLVPSEVETNRQTVKITLKIDGKDKTATLSGDNGVIIAKGTQSNITITLSNTEISVQTVNVENWNVVEVGEYKVTVKLDADVNEIKKDVWVMAYNDGDDVKIKAHSDSSRSLGCYITGEASRATAKDGDNIYTFTISGISSDITATVDYQRPTKLTLSKSNLTVSAGCSFRLFATVPDSAYYKTCTWSSNNNEVATVDENGRVMAKAAGEAAVITATTVKGGVSATCTLTVEQYSALPKEFSVGPAGENCKKVRFSRGNLKYTPDIDSWWFFDKQYDSGHDQNQLSLFTWGYGSWSTEQNTTDYASGTFTDWGTQVGDGNIWRTLSSSEWKYLLEDRTDAANKVGFATVCEIKGIIVLPDEFEDPATNESTSTDCVDNKFVPQSPDTDWDQNVYSAGDSWDKMEAAGALFLPAAGYRDGGGSTIGLGHYWSSSTGGAPNTAFQVQFIEKQIWTGISDQRSNGYSVRLVTNYNE